MPGRAMLLMSILLLTIALCAAGRLVAQHRAAHAPLGWMGDGWLAKVRAESVARDASDAL